MSNRTPLFQDMTTVHQFVAFATFIIATVVACSVLKYLFPDISVFWMTVVGAGAGTLVTAGIAIQGAKQAAERRAQVAREYQAMRDADTQKKIAEMQRKNSNIPGITR